MAMVAAAVGNGGKLMQPRLTEKVVDSDGPGHGRVKPERAGAS